MTKGSPYTVWLLVAVVVTALAALLVVGNLDAWLVGGGLVLLAASFGLIAGMWPAWLFLTVVAAGDMVAALFVWPAWWTVLTNGIMLALLLARPTRHHAVRWRPLPRG
jgi:hypothetical protein